MQNSRGRFTYTFVRCFRTPTLGPIDVQSLEGFTRDMQEFKHDRKTIRALKGTLVLCIVGLASRFALPFLEAEEKGNPSETLITTLILTFAFCVVSVLTWLTLRAFPFTNVAADDDGIWYMHIGKENGLISWKKIHAIKERSFMQCLDLLDSRGQKLLRVEYQLDGFAVLRNLINEKTSISPLEFHRSVFSKGPLYHLSFLVFVFCFSALGFYFAGEIGALVGYGLMSVQLALLTYFYLVTATGIKITDNGFVVYYPFMTRSITFSDVEDILIPRNRKPEVWIISKKSKRPFKLAQLRTGSNVIYKVLRQAAKL